MNNTTIQSILHDTTLEKLECELLLSFILNKPRSYCYAWPEQMLTPSQYEQFQVFVSRRLKGEPMAYILGEKEFWSLVLKVNKATLIPRPETECLVEAVLDQYPKDTMPLDVLDLGTGSGAIAIALAHERPHWKITAVDRDEIALAVAKENSKRLSLHNITCIQSDWFSKIINQTFDIIVSNPPYIGEHDSALAEEVKFFEPNTALFSENNGMADLEIIISQSPYFLKKNGALFVEHGYQQAKPVQFMMKNNGYQHIQSHVDLAGQPRFCSAMI